MSIQSFLDEFEKRLFKTKSYSSVMSEDVVAYRLLKSGNLSNHHEQLSTAIWFNERSTQENIKWQ